MPPAPRPVPWPACERCGDRVAPDGRDEGEPARHIVCDVAARRVIARRLEASRAVHRTIGALAALPGVRATIEPLVAELPDACDPADAIAFLSRARTLVECTRDLGPQQRRMALSFLDATTKRLGA